ncbi:hemolysin family protein [Mycolicibacterium hippocampi]|uniref:Membrane protein n=1 Tax=Mycolicibacterium hippocampi TaxID=659824 RepID=A0A7I9ZHV1_9MYCO|nr:hemolysin family protein [Mycolicibacterium hippocampi]GFH00267.1 membrane protein [Mycolicibacterium hippocampi]
MTGYWPQVALVVSLIVVNGVLAGSEAAYISLREGQLREFERRGKGRERVVVRLAREPNRFLATIQLGITLAGFLASATAAVTLAEPLVAHLTIFGDAAEAVGITIVTLLVALLTLVIGELAPKRLAMQHARRWAVVVALPLELLAVAARPVVWFLGKATDVVVRLLGGDPHVGREELTVEELRQLVTGHRGLSADQRTIITGALEIHERLLREVVVPRPAVWRVHAGLSVERARQELADSGHIRAPVVSSGDLDDVLGVVHLRDLLGSSGTVADVMHPVLRLPDSLRVSSALRRFMDEHEHFAMVIDERGGVAGIVTLEDLLEEIVGEIYDESDRDILSVTTLPDGTLLLPGTFPIHDLPDIGVDLDTVPKGNFATIAGLVVAELGRIPTGPGERVVLPEFTLEVTSVGSNAVTGVRLTRRTSA